MSVQPVPEGYHTVTPYLVVRDVPALLEFLRRAFDAEILERAERPDGVVMHAQVRLGDSMVMMGQAMEDKEVFPAMLYMYVEDCDAMYRQALEAGGESVSEPADQFYGDRHGGVRDPQGNLWWVGTHVEDVPPDEMKRRMAAHAGGE